MLCCSCGSNDDAYHTICQRCFDDARALARLRKWREERRPKHASVAVMIANRYYVHLTCETEYERSEIRRDGETLAVAAEAALKAWGEA